MSEVMLGFVVSAVVVCATLYLKSFLTEAGKQYAEKVYSQANISFQEATRKIENELNVFRDQQRLATERTHRITQMQYNAVEEAHILL